VGWVEGAVSGSISCRFVLAKKVEGAREQPSLAAKGTEGTLQLFPIRWSSYCVHLRFCHNTTGNIAMAVLVDICLTTLLIAQTVHFGSRPDPGIPPFTARAAESATLNRA
jgi:hypothetical protein